MEWATLNRPTYAACVVAVALAGCTLGPDYRRPNAPTSAYPQPSQHPGAVSLVYGGEVAADWYTLFHSDSLNTLVQEALRANPDLEGARHNLLAAQYELQAVSGTALPQVTVGARAVRARVNGSVLYEPPEMLQVTANQFNVGPSLAYDLDVFGRIRRSIEAQSAQTDQVGHEALNVYITLVNQVVLAAFNQAAADEQIQVTRSLVGDLQEQFDLTQTLENAGKIAHSDSLQAKAQLEDARANLPGLEKQRDVYHNALLRLLGKTPDNGALPGFALRDFSLPRQLPLSLPSQLVRQRPDVLEAEDTLHQASAEVGVAEAARFPSFDISAQYAQQSNKTGDLFTKAAQMWSVGLNVTQPLFAGGTLQAREKEARQRFLQAQAQYRGTVLDSFVDVANAMQALQHDTDGYNARTTALAAARENRDLARVQFQRGRVSELVVLTAEQQYQNGLLTQVQADVQRFADAANLFHALGGGWWNSQQNPSAPHGRE
ncbi:MAG: efflux transporter outer membrane subunit [Proteobacteria bacterium]|nr:efflux transporter outer membrane subunit [Pseudomonadota bacterium]